MTAAGAPPRASLVWRVLTTPVGPRILPRLLPERARYGEVLASSGLPREAVDLIGATVRRTRLWHWEQMDVARELIAHFSDGLAAGGNEQDLVRGYGNPATAARLIRRAKKRNRPLAWRAWVWMWRGLGVAAAVAAVGYAALAARYFSGAPRIARDYLPEIAAAAGAVPEADRAWPLYSRAKERLPADEDQGRYWRWDSIMPGDAEWPAVEAYLARSADSIALAREGAGRPRLGAQIRRYEFEGAESRPLMESLNHADVGTVIRLAWLLGADALRRASAGDGDGAMDDLRAVLSMAAQAREAPLASYQSTALGLLARPTTATIGKVLAAYPRLLRDQDLVELAHRLGSFAGGGTLTVNVQGERLVFLDMVQRAYTDDGHGDGRLTPQGREMAAPYTELPIELNKRLRRLADPVSSATALSRREMVEAHDLAMHAAVEAGAGRIGAWTVDPAERALEAAGPGARDLPFMRYNVPTYGALLHKAEITTQRRDAALTAIALELHRRAHGAYPATLAELTPRLLPAVPIDRFDGQTIKYRLRDGHPLLYSVGVDLKDDGGVPRGGLDGNDVLVRYIWPQQRRLLRTTPQGITSAGIGADWILWPTIDYDADGAAIRRAWDGAS